MINVHATLVFFRNRGILLLGESGVGKSDLALRMIIDYDAQLVADDRVNIVKRQEMLFGSAPDNLLGKMEIRGVGIGNFKALKESSIDLCVQLTKDSSSIERLPFPETKDFLGIYIPKITLNAYENSTICKIIAKISSIIS